MTASLSPWKPPTCLASLVWLVIMVVTLVLSLQVTRTTLVYHTILITTPRQLSLLTRHLTVVSLNNSLV